MLLFVLLTLTIIAIFVAYGALFFENQLIALYSTNIAIVLFLSTILYSIIAIYHDFLIFRSVP
jgi:hypothetical protein